MRTWRTGLFRRLGGVLLWATALATALLADPTQPLESPRWSAKLARVLARDLEHPPPPGAIVFAGSSSIERWPALSENFSESPVLNRGIGGSWLSDFADDAEQLVLSCRPRTVVLYAGENDLAAGYSPADVRAAFVAFHSRLRAEAPQARLIFLSIKPSPLRARLMPYIREANTLIAAECRKDPSCTFLDVFTPMLDENDVPRRELFSADGLHLSPAGYRLWNQLLEPVLTDARIDPKNTKLPRTARPTPAPASAPKGAETAGRES